MDYQIDWQSNGVVVKCARVVTSETIKRMNEAVLGAEKIRSCDYVILNALDIDEVYANEEDLMFYGASDAAAAAYITKKDMQFAIVTQNETMKKIFNTYKATTYKAGNTWNVEIFLSYDSAKTWVGIK